MPGLLGALTGAIDPKGTEQRLSERLAAQRDQETRRKQIETEAYEADVRAGKYGDIGPDEMMEHIHGIWSDNKQNKKFLDEHGEKVGAFHKVLSSLTGIMGPAKIPNTGPINASMASLPPAPFGPPINPPPPPSSTLSMSPNTATNTGALTAARQQAAREGTLNPPIPGRTSPGGSTPGSLFPLSKPPGMQAQQRQVGDIVTSKGVPHRITGINNDGSYQAEPLLGGGSSMGMQ